MTTPDTTADNLLRGSIERMAQALRAGEVSAQRLTQATIVYATDGKANLNAFLRLRTDAALAHARELDQEAAQGKWRGPLHGIPLAHKDCFARKGEPMSLGSGVIQETPLCQYTATPLIRLQHAGAVDLGALNLSEMIAGPTGQNPFHGDCLNAIDVRRISGGSSSGSGTAVAAGMVAASLGSDTGGSIRLPSSMQGIFGLKPTYGRVSRHGCFPRAPSLDCIGPMARSARDCAILLQAIVGVDPEDASSLPAAVPDYLKAIDTQAEGSRVAVFDSGIRLDAAIQHAFDHFSHRVALRYGALRHASFPALQACYAMGDICAKVEAATTHARWMAQQPQAYSQAVYSRTEPGLHIPAVRYLETLSMRAHMLRHFLQDAFAASDVLILPTMPVEVPTREAADMEAGSRVFSVVARLTALTRPFSYLGLPVLSMPIGVDSAGMPIGAQLVGKPFSEARLLAMADALSSVPGRPPQHD